MHHEKDTGLEASQIRIFNDTPMKCSGHPDIMEFCLLSNTEVLTSYFVYNHTLDEKGYFQICILGGLKTSHVW